MSNESSISKNFVDVLINNFIDLPINKRYSILDLLISIALSDENDDKPNPKEMKILEILAKNLGFELDDAISSFDNIEETISTLQSLNNNQKELLVVISMILIEYDGLANKDEMKTALYYFNKIGISKENIERANQIDTSLSNSYKNKNQAN
jgi:hypothetical protein